MRIGIITLPLHYNYGGILQAYALQTVLERMGHDVKVVRLSQKKQLPSKAILRYTKRFLMKVFLDRNVSVFSEKDHNKEFPILTAKTWRFVEKYIHSYIISEYSEIQQSMFDCFVVGSDQVWRSGYTRSVMVFFLDFADGWDIKRIAYAASFGLDTWTIPSEETKSCSLLAQKFNSVSVRENSGVYLCKEYLGVEAEIVLDPTLLLYQEDYLKLIEDAYNDKVLASYLLDETPEKLMILGTIQKKQNLPILKLFTKEHHKIQPLASVEEWLNTFRKSDFVYTDSFHGTVFSILFNKQFVVFTNKHRGNSRMQSLLSQFGLENRMINSLEDYKIIENDIIDYSMVNIKLDALREKSMQFLINSLC